MGKYLNERGQTRETFERIKAYIEGGGNYTELGQAMAAEGYTNSHDGPLDGQDISHFMRQRGYRRKAKYSKKAYKRRAAATNEPRAYKSRITSLESGSHDPSEDVLTVLALAESKSLSSAMKIKLIKAAIS